LVLELEQKCRCSNDDSESRVELLPNENPNLYPDPSQQSLAEISSSPGEQFVGDKDKLISAKALYLIKSRIHLHLVRAHV
jgi:hypothetical protein